MYNNKSNKMFNKSNKAKKMFNKSKKILNNSKLAGQMAKQITTLVKDILEDSGISSKEFEMLKDVAKNQALKNVAATNPNLAKQLQIIDKIVKDGKIDPSDTKMLQKITGAVVESKIKESKYADQYSQAKEIGVSMKNELDLEKKRQLELEPKIAMTEVTKNRCTELGRRLATELNSDIIKGANIKSDNAYSLASNFTGNKVYGLDSYGASGYGGNTYTSEVKSLATKIAKDDSVDTIKHDFNGRLYDEVTKMLGTYFATSNLNSVQRSLFTKMACNCARTAISTVYDNINNNHSYNTGSVSRLYANRDAAVQTQSLVNDYIKLDPHKLQTGADIEEFKLRQRV
jgi:primosomal protein N''